MLEKWISYVGLDARVEIGAILTYLGISNRCEFADSAASLRSIVARSTPQDYSVLIGNTGSDVSDINLAAAIVKDGNARCVVLVRSGASGSLRSRAAKAGVDFVIDPMELGDLVKVGRGYQSYGADRLSQPLPEASDYVASIQELNTYLQSLIPLDKTLKAPILTFTSGRGGVGKTTLVSSMALLASSWGLKVALVDFDLSYGNAFEKLGIRQPKDFSDLVADVPSEKESLLEKATCIHKNLYLFGPCVKPEMAELLFPCVSHFLQAVSGLVDLVLVDTTTASTDCYAQAAQCAVRLGVARTRIIRLENKANPRVKQDFSVGKAEVGLEAAKMFRIFEGGPGFQELIQQGKLSVLLQEETSFAQSVSFVLAHFLNELGILPQLREAQIALQATPEKKPFSLFNRRKEVG